MSPSPIPESVPVSPLLQFALVSIEAVRRDMADKIEAPRLAEVLTTVPDSKHKQKKMNAVEFLSQQLASCGLGWAKEKPPEDLEVVLYDDSDPISLSPKSQNGHRCPRFDARSKDDSVSFIRVLMENLVNSHHMVAVKLLKGGFLDFQARFPELCEGAPPPTTPGARSAKLSLTSLSQPCLPVSNQGPTRILPFLYLGSQQDALDNDTLKRHGINYVVNLSNTCPQPEFLEDRNFLRIPVNDSYTEKLLPHFEEAFGFLEKVREANQCVLVHCLAGISRSPTLAIAYIMRHLHMTSEEAYRYIKEKRPSVSPNFNFLGQLLEFEKQLKASRGKEVEAQLKESRRKALVLPLPKATSVSASFRKTTSCEAPPQLLRIVSTPAHSESLVIKRSFSCPVKIHRGDAFLQVAREDPLRSPSGETNSNGKRQMKDSDVEMGETSAVDRPRGFGSALKTRRAALNIPNPVQEDLPSPSTELSKLSFVPSTPSPADRPPLPFPDPCATTEEVQKPTYPSSGQVCAANPFFSCSQPPAASDVQFSFGCVSPASAAERTGGGTGIPAVTVTQPTPPILQASPGGFSIENPLFTKGRRSKGFRFGAKYTQNKDSETNKVQALEMGAEDKTVSRRRESLTRRFGSFLRRASMTGAAAASCGSSVATGIGLIGGLFLSPDADFRGGVARSSTATGISSSVSTPRSPPSKSKSESALLYSFCEELDSPESGFVESPVESSTRPCPSPYGRDPDRESISSTSSLEITVN